MQLPLAHCGFQLLSDPEQEDRNQDQGHRERDADAAEPHGKIDQGRVPNQRLWSLPSPDARCSPSSLNAAAGGAIAFMRFTTSAGDGGN